MNKPILKAHRDRLGQTDVAFADPKASGVLTVKRDCQVECSVNQQPADDCEEAIRAAAHGKWEAAGCRAGDGVEFWLEAERELNAERSGSRSAQG